MKTLVVYFSRKGSNKYLAEKISAHLNCDIEAIKPKLNFFYLMLFGTSFGIKKLKYNIEDYERIILCGPIWMGKFIAPLKSFARKYSDKIKNLVFVTCCGSTYEKKDEKFGHGLVFKEVAELLKDKKVECHAFPIVLVFPEDKKDDGQEFMKTHLNDSNFNGEIKTRFDEFLKALN